MMAAGLARRVLSLAGWAMVAVLVYLAWPAQLGGHLSLVVVSGHSMDGTYRTGDLLLAWPERDYALGDVIVYKIPKGEPASGLRVVHRVIDKQDGHFTTQGDNRDSPDFWRPTTHDVVGQPFFRVGPAGSPCAGCSAPSHWRWCAACASTGPSSARTTTPRKPRTPATTDAESEDSDTEQTATTEYEAADEDAREPEPALPR